MPTVTLRAEDVGPFLDAYKKRLAEGLTRAARDDISAAKAELIRASSGPHTLKALAAAGHPYAVRAPNDDYDPEIINTQMGEFRAAWKSEPPTITQDGRDLVVSVQCVNRSRVARYMKGTRKMRKRDIVGRVERIIRPRIKTKAKRIVRDAIEAAKRDVRAR